MESDSWVVQNLVNALNTWNDKLAEIWQIITQSPEEFKGGGIWNVIVDIHGSGKDLRKFYRGKETRTCIKIIRTICNCKRRDCIWSGTYDGTISYRAGNCQYHYEYCRI